MAGVKAAKESLEQYFTAYKHNKTLLTRLIARHEAETSADNSRTIARKLSAFQSAVRDLNNAHTQWVSKAGFTPAQLAELETFSESWLEEIWTEFDDLCIQAE